MVQNNRKIAHTGRLFFMNYILFSPVGKTDPITNYHDGSLLHISRHYQPEIIYLYMSKEMSEFHHLDNRYCKCLEWLQKKRTLFLKFMSSNAQI